MPLIEAALAFAITMLALSLICSSFVEIIHRTFKLRESGLKYMLEQLFDQVLVKYLEPLAQQELANNPALQGKSIQDAYAALRKGFVVRMTANRAPVGLKADPTLAAAPLRGDTKPRWRPGNIWGGRRVTALTPTEFMERLGSSDVGDAIRNTAARGPADAVGVLLNTLDGNIDQLAQELTKAGVDPARLPAEALNMIRQTLRSDEVSDRITQAASAAGAGAADAVDTVVKDIAQKFDGFGKDAGSYFEGRARLMSVTVAIVLAFVVHVDAIDLFRTYLRDPNARAKVIEQSQAITAQYEASQKAVEAAKKLDPTATPPPSDDVKKQVEALQKDALTAITNANSAAEQFAGLGVPLGWSDERIKAADMSVWIWTCKDPKTRQSQGLETVRGQCTPDEKDYTGLKGRQFMDVWVEVPRAPHVWFYLFLGGLLIGLGSPFWYDVVTSLTTLRNAAGGKAGTAAPPQSAAAPAADAAKAQPVTPVDAFQVSNRAAALAPKPVVAAAGALAPAPRQ
jgi:hypothetical protein